MCKTSRTRKTSSERAANQAAVALQSAWLLSARKRVADELDRGVARRTGELEVANTALQKEIGKRQSLAAANLKAYEEIAALKATLEIEVVQRQYILQVLEKAGWLISGHNGAGTILDMHPNTIDTPRFAKRQSR